MAPGRAPRVYIAGPDVFLPDAAAALQRKKAICAQFGLEGVTPFDNEVAHDPAAQHSVAQQIYAANRDFMHGCAGCIANASPFRGLSIDPGTAFEIGYMCALGRTVFAYSIDARLYEERVAAAAEEPSVRAHTDGGFVTETFGLPDNLMLPFGVLESGGAFLVAEDGAPADAATDEALFRRCAQALAGALV
ncbi:MAG: nucleoside 2-deoxyribosyltransferase [Pseudomonadota bacterium]